MYVLHMIIVYLHCLAVCDIDRSLFWCYRYLHKNEIVHGNLSLASIFIQHNGLVKIGSGTVRDCVQAVA